MISGNDNLQLINQHIYQAQAEQEQAGQRLEELHRQLNALRLKTSESYRQMAKLRLDDLQASQLISRLDETDQVVLNLLEKLKDARNNLDEQIKASIARQRQLEAQRKELEGRRDGAGQAMQQQLVQTRQRLQETEAYRQQQQRVQEAAAVVKNADEKASRAEQDRIDKGKPYEADPLFMYLWNRRYLTPDYRSGWFSRQLDAWVARLVDFQRNRANYRMLLELPLRLREHATKVQQTAQLEFQALQDMERKAAEADGILTLQAKVQDAEKQLKQLDADIEAEEARHQELLQQQSGLNAGTDPLTKQIIDLISAALEKEPLANLYQEARATPRPEDDVIVVQLQQLQQQQSQIEAEIQSLNNIMQQRLRDLGQLEEVRRRYRQSGYDSYNSRFPGNFSLGVLLGQMLGGMMSSDTVWREIGRHQQSSPPGGTYGGGDAGVGDFGGFGGMGGGEFRTGGEF
jgi:DNA repair exonuclease SbcCD ATPase subunit